jgi:hypothetical protein
LVLSSSVYHVLVFLFFISCSSRVVGYFEPAFSLNHNIFFPNLTRSIRTMRTPGQSWSRQAIFAKTD